MLFSVQDGGFCQKRRQKYGVRKHQVPLLLLYGKVADGSAEEYLGDSDPNLVAGNGEGNFNVDGDDCQCHKQSREGEGSNGLPKGLVSHGRVIERQLDIALCSALSEYVQILETFAYIFEFISGWIACAHQFLD